jgi:hypothetical protein
MATYTQRGSVTVDAFQWNGGVIVVSNLPIWARRLPLQVCGIALDVPVGLARGVSGTLPANPTDWVYLGPDGSVNVMTNAQFTLLYS